MPDVSEASVSSAVRIRQTGVITGYAFDPENPLTKLTVQILVGEKVVCARLCDRKNPLFAPENAPRSGFTVAPNEHPAAWLDLPVTVRVMGTEKPLTKRPLDFRKLVRLEKAVDTDAGLIAIVAVPDRLQRFMKVSADIDGQRLRSVSEYERDCVSLHFPPVLASAGAVQELSLVWAAGNKPVGGSPQAVAAGTANLLQNSRFAAWEGALPVSWQTSSSPNVQLRPTLVESGGEVRRLNTAVDFAVEAEISDPVGRDALLLAKQAIVLPVASQGLEVRLRARAIPARPVIVAVANKQGLSAVIDVTAQWAEYSHLFTLDGDDGPVELQLELAAAASEPGHIEVALFAAGAPDFHLPLAAGLRSQERVLPIVTNGSFKQWPNGLDFTGSSRYLETAQNWWLACKPAMPKVSVRLDQVILRDLGAGGDLVRSYGLSLSGAAVGSWLRLEAALDKVALAAAPADALSFVIGLQGEMPVPTRIERIYVFRRTRPADGSPPHDEPITALCTAIDALREPRRFHRELSDEVRHLLRLAAALAVASPEQELFVAFEFKPQQLGIVLADVQLGPAKPAAAKNRPILSGYVALEDLAIKRQLSRLKGFEPWGRAVALPSGSVSTDATNEKPLARWSWGTAPTSIDIIIPVHNAVDEVVACLRAQERATTLPHRLVLVDDGSDFETRAVLDEFARSRPWVDLVRLPTNAGYTRACNIGFSRSRSEWVVLLNSDTCVTEHWLEGLLECATSAPDLGAVGPLSNAASWQSVPELRAPRGGWMVNSIPAGMTLDAFAATLQSLSERAFPQVPLLNGFCTMFRRAALDEVGYLDETAFPMGYGEENDLCIRLGKAGYRLAIADHVYVHHSKSASFGEARRSQLSKAGTATTKSKHPDIDLAQLEVALAECVPLTRLRQKLRMLDADTVQAIAAGKVEYEEGRSIS